MRDVCLFPPVSWGLAGSTDGEATLTVRVADDCTAVVDDALAEGVFSPEQGSDVMRGYAPDADLVFSYETRD